MEKKAHSPEGDSKEARPGYTDAEVIANLGAEGKTPGITNLVLRPAAYSQIAARKRSVPAPRVITACHGCELHHEGVRCAICSMRMIVAVSTARGKNARQL